MWTAEIHKGEAYQESRVMLAPRPVGLCYNYPLNIVQTVINGLPVGRIVFLNDVFKIVATAR